MSEGPRLPLSKATAYAARVLAFKHSTSGCRYEDVEDVASEAWLLYWKLWHETGRDDLRRFRWWVIDYARKLLGRFGGGIYARLAYESDFDHEDGIEYPSIRHNGFDDVDIADDVDAVERRGYTLLASVLRLRMEDHSIADACASLNYSPTAFHVHRRRFLSGRRPPRLTGGHGKRPPAPSLYDHAAGCRRGRARKKAMRCAAI